MHQLTRIPSLGRRIYWKLGLLDGASCFGVLYSVRILGRENSKTIIDFWDTYLNLRTEFAYYFSSLCKFAD